MNQKDPILQITGEKHESVLEVIRRVPLEVTQLTILKESGKWSVSFPNPKFRAVK